MAAPWASAASLSQLDRQLRQKAARFIRSMFWTSVRERRCSTRRRKTAASSSVLVLSSIVMTRSRYFAHNTAIKWGTVTDFPYRKANLNLRRQNSGDPHGLKAPPWPVDSHGALARNRQ